MENQNREKLKQVAKLLNMDFLEKYDHGDAIQNKEVYLFVRYDGYSHKGKWRVSVSVDRSNKVYISKDVQNALTLAINVSPKKSAEVIANDIKRRLLPDSLKYAALVNEALGSHDDYNLAVKKNMEKILELTGGKLPDLEKTHEIGFSNRFDGELAIYGTASVQKDSVYLDIRNVTPAQAVKILKLLGVNGT